MKKEAKSSASLSSGWAISVQFAFLTLIPKTATTVCRNGHGMSDFSHLSYRIQRAQVHVQSHRVEGNCLCIHITTQHHLYWTRIWKGCAVQRQNWRRSRQQRASTWRCYIRSTTQQRQDILHYK